jgi:hypothetical protein
MSSKQSPPRRGKRASIPPSHTTLATNSTPATNIKPTTTTTRNTRPYDRDFQQKLIDGGVYPDEYEYPDGRIPARPNNWEEINQRLAQPRPSLSSSQFSDNKFRKFKRADAHASKEDQVMKRLIPFIEGEIIDDKFASGNTRSQALITSQTAHSFLATLISTTELVLNNLTGKSAMSSVARSFLPHSTTFPSCRTSSWQ